MSYTTIDDPTIYFNTKLTTGTGNSQTVTGLGFQPDWIWGKNRAGASHSLFDSVRGITKGVETNNNGAEFTTTDYYSSFDSDGFTIASGGSGAGNGNGETAVQWCWKAGGTAPAITYVVKVVSDSGNKYRFDDFGTSAVTLDLQEGGTYTFDQSDSSNATHPLRFYTAADKSGGEYTTGVTTSGTAGSSGAKTVITVAASAPTLYYQCSSHSAMGGQANTNSTFGSSNFGGSIQSTVSAGSTQGFSIVSWTGNATAGATIGHGLGSKPSWMVVKRRNSSEDWRNYHSTLGATKFLNFTNNAAGTSSNRWNDTEPTTSVFTIGDHASVNGSGDTFIAYLFAEKKGYSKFGSYTGNGNADGTFVYTGFKPAFVLIKVTSTTNDWEIHDNKRGSSNVINAILQPNLSDAESTSGREIDFLSNGFKLRNSNSQNNLSGGTFIYMAFAESPFVNSNGVPTNAR